MSIPGPNYDRSMVDGTRSLEAPFVKWMGKLIDIQKEIKGLDKKLDGLKVVEAIIVIETLENENHKNVLALRYIGCLTLGEICDKLYISISIVKRWHQNALDMINFEK